MPRITVRSMVVLPFILLFGCVSNPPVRQVHRVWVAPRVDLKAYEIIGMVGFSSTSKGQLASMATQRFVEAARRDQDMVRMVDVGTQREALASIGQDRWTPESCRAVAQKHGVRTLFLGTLTLSKVKPMVQLSALLNSGQVTAQVDATLQVQMIEAESGASIWSTSSSSTRTVGQVSVFGKEYTFNAADPERAYGDLIDSLVNDVARDFQGSWQTE